MNHSRNTSILAVEGRLRCVPDDGALRMIIDNELEESNDPPSGAGRARYSLSSLVYQNIGDVMCDLDQVVDSRSLMSSLETSRHAYVVGYLRNVSGP